MRGKTADEVAGLSDQMYAELLKRAPASPAPAPAPAPANNIGMPNQDLWLTDPNAAAQQMLQHARQTEFAPALATMAAQMGSTAREVVRRDYAEDFTKYGPEIDLFINQMDPQFRTIDNITKVVGMVRANHLDEIVAERAARKLDDMIAAGSVLRSGSAPNGPVATAPGTITDFKTAGLPDNYRRMLDRYGVTPETLDEFLLKTTVASTGCTLAQAREKWVESAKKGDIVTERPSGALV